MNPRTAQSTPITLRPAGPADNALLAEMGAQTFADTFGPDNTPENMAAYLAASFSPARQAAELAEPNSLFLIAEVDGKAQGYVHLRERPAPASVSGERPLEIGRLYARQAFISRGVGAALMRASLDEAARRGCDTVWLDVWEHNPRAIAFYERWGFKKVGTAAFPLGDDLQTDWIMQTRIGDSP
jgi:ribosomal protein S18 acetylase RimI-like enzyme